MHVFKINIDSTMYSQECMDRFIYLITHDRYLHGQDLLVKESKYISTINVTESEVLSCQPNRNPWQ